MSAITEWRAVRRAADKVNALADNVNGQIRASGQARRNDYDAYLRALDEHRDLVAIYGGESGLLVPESDADRIAQWRRCQGAMS